MRNESRGPFETPSFMGWRPGLLDLPPLVVTELRGDEFGTGLGRKALGLAADAFLRRLQRSPGLHNADTGWLLAVNRQGRKKMGDNAGLTAAEMQAVAGIHMLVHRAVVVERHPDMEHGNPDVVGILRFHAPAAIGGRIYRVKLTVKDYKDGGKTLHALSAAEMENAPLGTFPAYSGAGALQQGQPTTGRTVSIADLLYGATLEDGSEFWPHGGGRP